MNLSAFNFGCGLNYVNCQYIADVLLVMWIKKPSRESHRAYHKVIYLFCILMMVVFVLSSCISMDLRGLSAELFGIADFRFYVLNLTNTSYLHRDDPTIVDPISGSIILYGAGSDVLRFKLLIPYRGQRSCRVVLSDLTLKAASTSRTEASKSEKVGGGSHKGEGLSRIDPFCWRLYRIEGLSYTASDDAYACCLGIKEKGVIYDKLVELSFPSGEDSSKGDARNTRDVGSDDNKYRGLKRVEFYITFDEKKDVLLLCELALPSGLSRGEFTGRIDLHIGRTKVSRKIELISPGYDLPELSRDFFLIVDLPWLWRLYLQGSQDRAFPFSDLFTLPSDRLAAEELSGPLGRCIRLVSLHNLQPLVLGMYPKITLKRDGAVEVDLDSYSILAEAITKNMHSPLRYLPLPVSFAYPPRSRFGPYTAPLYRKVLAGILQSLDTRIFKTGLLGRPLYIPSLPTVLDNTAARYSDYLELTTALNQVLSDSSFSRFFDIAFGFPFIAVDLRALGWGGFGGYKLPKGSDIILSEEYFLTPQFISLCKKASRKVLCFPDSFLGSYPYPRLFYPPSFFYILPWAAEKYDIDGAVVGAATGLSENNLRLSLPIKTDPFLYFDPGGLDDPNEPKDQRDLRGGRIYPSLRLKYIDDAIRQLRYIKILKEKGLSDSDFLADIVQRIVRGFLAESASGSIWTPDLRFDLKDARLYLIRPIFVLKLLADSRSEFKCRMLLSQLLSGKDRVFLDFLGARLRRSSVLMERLEEGGISPVTGEGEDTAADTETIESGFRWDYYFRLTNISGEDLKDLTLRMENIAQSGLPSVDLPPPTFTEAHIETLPPSIPYTLRVHSYLDSLYFGVSSLEYKRAYIERKDISGSSHIISDIVIKQPLSYAMQLTYPLKIDADISDWPLQRLAVISGFTKGVHREALQYDPSSYLSPSYPTEVRIAADSENLYILAICYQPMSRLRVRSSNSIPTSFGLPFGEDLFVVYIDPENSNTEDVSGLYGIVVKPGGGARAFRGSVAFAYLEERRSHSYLSIPFTSAVRVEPDRWIVELAIPFAAFGLDKSFKKGIFGMDFVRISADPPEISSWSGLAPYSRPLGLGNVLIDIE